MIYTYPGRWTADELLQNLQRFEARWPGKPIIVYPGLANWVDSGRDFAEAWENQ